MWVRREEKRGLGVGVAVGRRCVGVATGVISLKDGALMPLCIVVLDVIVASPTKVAWEFLLARVLDTLV
jgi:hypothetical protein